MSYLGSKKHKIELNKLEEWLTKYVVGANPNPPKNPRSALKKGNVTARNVVNAEISTDETN